MSNTSILLIDPNFDPSLTERLHLTIKVGVDTFSYAIADDELLYVVYDEQECESGAQKLLEKLKSDPYLKLDYKEVKLALQTENLICVPNLLVSDEFIATQSAYFNKPFDKIYKREQNQDFTLLFSLPEKMAKCVDLTWPEGKKYTTNTGLLQLLTASQEPTLLLDFSVKSFEIIYHNGTQISFQKQIEFDSHDEFVYYLLLIIKQLQITSNTAIKVCGIIHEGDETWNYLNQYFNEVAFITAVSSLNTSILDDMPAHYYTSLLALQECE